MINKRNILALIVIIIPLLLIGASNYFFAASSYHFITDPVTNERTGRYWAGDIDGVLMALVLCAIAVVIWIPAARYGWIKKLFVKLNDIISDHKQRIKENKKKYFIFACILILIPVVAFGIDLVFSLFNPRILGHTIRRVIFFTTTGLVLYSIILLRGKPEKQFFSVSLIIGFMYVITHPMLFFGFDNEMHFAWIVEESYLRNVSVTESDYILSRTFQTGYFGWLPAGENNAVVFSFPKGEDTLTWTGQSTARPLYTRLAHIPMGLTLYVGRSLTLNPNVILWMVMFSSHLLYTFVVYFALKRLNSGKYLMAAIALVPLTFLVSAGLGYDGWIKAFLLLGFAYCFYELQTPGEKIKLKSMVIMIGAFLLGLAPRAIYFPLLLILFCINKEKFQTAKGYKLYLLAVTGAILFVFLSLAIPYFTSGGADFEDPRGGDNVDTMGQIMFILQNPLVYTGILLNFLKDYINIFSGEKFISWYISYEHLSYPALTMLLICTTALTDRCEKDRLTSSVWLKVFTAGIIFATVSIFVTSLYISFTNVGAHHISGVQRRYLIALLFPFFYIVCNFKIILRLNEIANSAIVNYKLENRLNKATYSIFVFGIMAFVLLSGAWNTFLI